MALDISAEKITELKTLGGDALVTKLFSKFTENSAKLLADAKTALATADAAKVDYCVHTLKGSAMSLGIGAMSKILIDLNARTKVKNLEGVGPQLDELVGLLEEVRQYQTTNFPI
ncbi:MAG: Hpt domain-containing protein [Spirochaetes bacterium]|nr:Hpt domain-containing protein [Spirochaetota bacterium]